MSGQAKRFRGFISYSQKDKAHARHIHRALEDYRVPTGIEAAGVDPKLRKLGRFFRDDEEMGAATDLGAALQGAIADAENLIVLCSPNAAQSKWVNEEIIHFKRTGRADRIFAVIVAGEPNSGDERECFPPALQFELGPDGALSERRTEPLAVDVRKESFSRVLARLVAGLILTPFDALWKRELRRARARAVTTLLTICLAALMLVGAVTQNFWRPSFEAYWKYARIAHSSEDLMAAAPGATFQDCREGTNDCPVMVVVPEGTFLMGSPEGDPNAAPDEFPQREISVARFAVSQHEITFADWATCVAAGGCDGYQPDRRSWEGDDHPVINVSWDDAQSYVDWLSLMTGYAYRLPSEAEWEYAARAGSTGQYSWGDDPPDCDPAAPNSAAWIRCQPERTWPVGSFPANAFNLYDMHGNVYEYVEDCYASYDDDGRGVVAVPPTEQVRNSRSEAEAFCRRRVIRGGSFDTISQALRSANRSGSSFRRFNIGFRVARTVSPPPSNSQRSRRNQTTRRLD